MSLVARTDLHTQRFGEQRLSDIPIIVLTGGPCGGKTTLMRELRAADPECRRWVLVPEAAPLLFRAGLDARKQDFQVAVVQLQMALEDACVRAAAAGRVLVCHRGTLDALAYWLDRGWEEKAFFVATSMSREYHLRRYSGVVHLQTTAIGVESEYRKWPESERTETTDEASAIDSRCAVAWAGHSQYLRIENANITWEEKSQLAKRFFNHLLLRKVMSRR